jgi:hypothetical protein
MLPEYNFRFASTDDSLCGPIRTQICSSKLQQTKTPQFAPQILRHVAGARCGAVEVARRIARGEITPPLKRAIGPRLDQNGLAIEHDVAAADAFFVDERADVENPLPAHDLSTNHPVERAVADDFSRTLRHHAGRMIAFVLARSGLPGALAPRLELLLDPILKVADGVAADAKFDEV